MNLQNNSSSFPLHKLIHPKNQMLNWAARFGIFCFLDDHQYNLTHHSVDWLLAVGSRRQVEASAGNALDQLQKFLEKNTWALGHLSYDLKNETEDLVSRHPDHTGFPDLFFFEPEMILYTQDNELVIEGSDDARQVFESILKADHKIADVGKPLQLKARMDRDTYLQKISEVKDHIRRGDCYELNYCQEFFQEEIFIDPLALYTRLVALSPNPFSAFYKVNDKYLLCASPERYIKRTGSKLLSQPMKGTARRFDNSEQDQESREMLFRSEKERSENVMVVDLVRNDLARVCREGTVKVDELFGIYSFPQVHQMISTVSGELPPDISFTDIIRASFPMGSMTGAPKKRVMELIDELEMSRRGIFSGALGYIKPGGDFDMNVVIRSLVYNSNSGYLSYQAGSAITYYSEAEKEYEECLLKAATLKLIGNS